MSISQRLNEAIFNRFRRIYSMAQRKLVELYADYSPPPDYDEFFTFRAT